MAEQLADGKLPGIEKIREEVISRFLKSVEERGIHQDRLSARPITIEPYPADGPLCKRNRRRLRHTVDAQEVGCTPSRRD
jgi:hypothetical protein